MADKGLTRIFISYSRQDSTQFVVRLEESLKALGFATWVDRSELEGGQDWQDTIQRAIKRCHVTLVVLTPLAVESEFVRDEYRYAKSIGLPIIPIMYKSAPVPIDLIGIQWVSFEGDYQQGLLDLAATLSHVVRAGRPLRSADPTAAAAIARMTREQIRRAESARKAEERKNKRWEKAEERRDRRLQRPRFVADVLRTSGLGISICVVACLVSVGTLVGIYAPAWLPSLPALSFAGITVQSWPALSPSMLSLIAVGLGMFVTYALAYRRTLRFLDMVLLTILSVVLTYGVLRLMTGAPLVHDISVRFYNRPFAGTIALAQHQSVSLGFALGFAATYAVIVGILSVPVVVALLAAADQFDSDWLLLWIVLYGVGPFILGAFITYSGWLDGGLVLGTVCGCFVGWLSIGDDDITDRIIAALLAGLGFTLAQWVSCAWVFGIDSHVVLLWLAGAAAGLVGATGVSATARIWRIIYNASDR